jgi:Na+-transporting NADH:ubiquinone oxidoreductase subunit C
MPTDKIPGWMRRFRELPNDSPAKTLIVALTVSLVCALLVSTAAVLLRPAQAANREREREQQILDIVARLPGVEDLLGSIDAPQIEVHVIDFATGNYVPSIDPREYDQGKAAQDPQQSIELHPEQDIASIERRASYGTVYLVKKEDRTELFILPVHGSGYASTLYGYLALGHDANTVVALSFFEHSETPGMGARIDDPEWRIQWQGKKVRDAAGNLQIGVASGRVDPADVDAEFQVDAITGATRTTRGITNLLRFWMGEHGFGPYLRKIRSEQG